MSAFLTTEEKELASVRGKILNYFNYHYNGDISKNTYQKILTILETEASVKI